MISLLILSFCLSLLFTGFLRKSALMRSLMDVPNGRSSHKVPTPRGGGLGFALVFLALIPVLSYMGYMVRSVGTLCISAGLFIALLGFMDDRRHLPIHLRLVSQIAACGFALYWLGGMPSIVLFGWIWPIGNILNVVSLIYFVWLINLYNFMDGIDGLAVVEAITVCLGGALLYWMNGAYAFMGLPLVLAFAVAGFLWWNIPVARIFMGDAGSGFLGFVLGLFTIEAAFVKPVLFWCWLILLGVFIVDTTLTLLVRLFQGMRIYEAHRDHAYQHATFYVGTHMKVTLGVLVINCCWLLPWAILVDRFSVDGLTGLILAYIPLVFLAIYFRAGRSVERAQFYNFDPSKTPNAPKTVKKLIA